MNLKLGLLALLKRQIGIRLAVVTVIYCVLAYIFMWPPVVTKFESHDPVNPCINHLRSIDQAIQTFARENKSQLGKAITLGELKPFLPNQKIPECPYGGSYVVSVIGAIPTCSFTTNDATRRIRYRHFYYVTTTPAHVLP